MTGATQIVYLNQRNTSAASETYIMLIGSVNGASLNANISAIVDAGSAGGQSTLFGTGNMSYPSGLDKYWAFRINFNTGDVIWERYLNRNDYPAYGTCADIIGSNSFATAGYLDSEEDVILLNGFSLTGTTIAEGSTTKQFIGTSNLRAKGIAINPANSSVAYVTGTTERDGTTFAVLFKYGYGNPSTLSTQKYFGNSSYITIGNAIASDSSGNPYVACNTTQYGNPAWVVGKFSTSFNNTWQKSFIPASGYISTSADSIIKDVSSNIIYVMGTVADNSGNSSFLLSNHSSVDGSVSFQKLVAPPSTPAVSTVGKVYKSYLSSDIFACGTIYYSSSNTYKGQVLRLDNTGNILWQREIECSASNNIPVVLSISSVSFVNGTTFLAVAGNVKQPSLLTSYGFIMKIRADGTETGTYPISVTDGSSTIIFVFTYTPGNLTSSTSNLVLDNSNIPINQYNYATGSIGYTNSSITTPKFLKQIVV